jgi:hypothetical protein
MKISKIDLSKLRNEEHFQLMTDVSRLIEIAGAETLEIPLLFPVFKGLLSKEDIALEIIRKNRLSESIADADAKRGSVYRGFVLLIKTYNHSSIAAKVRAAQNIQVIIEHYGDFRKKSYNEETASINNFLQDINDRCVADIAVLDAQDWITDLADANQTFDNLMNQRFDENAGREIVNMNKVRKEIITVYEQIVEHINASMLLNGETVYADFVKKLNERIAYFKNTLAIRKGRAAKKKSAEA